MNNEIPIEKIITLLLGGFAEPIGETHVDDEKLKIQEKTEELIDYLLDDIFRCLEKKNVYWGSGQVAARKAEKYLTELRDTIDSWLREYEDKEEESEE